MFWTLLAAAVATQAVDARPVVRIVTIGAYTNKLAPLADLKPEEVVVSHGGRKAAVLGIEPDARPLAVAIVVDSSAAIESVYRSELVAAVMAFWKGLPAGSRVAVWTSGPPSRVVDFGTEAAAAEPRLLSVAAAGKNYAFDALLDAARALEKEAGSRRALVFVGGLDVEASRQRTSELQQAVGKSAATPMLVMIVPGASLTPLGGATQGSTSSWDVQGYLEKMAAVYGGSSADVLTPQAATKKLQEAAVDLSSQYQVRYESSVGESGTPKVELKRKGAKLRVGGTGIEVAKLP
jgi:hypothetical protein